MHIIYSVSPINGSVALQYSQSIDCELIKEFKLENVDHREIEVKTTDDEYYAENAYSDLAKDLWLQLRDIDVIEDSEGEIALGEQFHHFNTGTSIYDVWHWFEESFDFKVGKDLMFI